MNTMQGAVWDGVCLGVLGALTLWAYRPLVRSNSEDWTFMKTWDDDTNFIDNDLFRSLSAQHLRRMWSTTMINVYEPVAWFIKALVFHVAGFDSRAFRLASLFFHWANASLTFLISQRLLALWQCGKRTALRRTHVRLGCLVGAALFATHPLHVEVVGWPTRCGGVAYTV